MCQQNKVYNCTFMGENGHIWYREMRCESGTDPDTIGI